MALWAFLFCAALIAYGPALRGGLIVDDVRNLTPPDLQSFHGLWSIWFELGATQQFSPVLHSAFWVEHRIWGDAVLGYHLANVALHAFSAFLVILIVKRLGLPGAWLAGFVFALHPVCVESVAWISEQKNTLSGVFYLSSALTYLRFDQTRRRSHYLLALSLFVLALGSKSVTSVLPAVLIVLLWWMRGPLTWRRDVLPLLPWFGLAVPAGLLAAYVERVYIGATGAGFALTLPQRVLLSGRAPWFYAWKAVWPTDLVFYYPHWKIDPSEWWQYLFPAALAAMAIALGIVARRNRGPLAAFLIFGGTLFPVLGYLNVYFFRMSYVADHFQYLAILAIIVPVSSWLTTAVRRISPGRTGAIAVPALLVTTLGFMTWQRSGDYRDWETLFSRALAGNPGSYWLHLGLGNVLFEKPGQLSAAIGEFQAAVRIDPGSAEAHNNLGNALRSSPGRLPEAVAEFQAALRINPESPVLHFNLGNILSRIPGRLPDAINEYQTAIRIFQSAARIDPKIAEAHNNLGNALRLTPGRLPEAVEAFQTALRYRPDFAEAHNNLGLAYTQMPGRQTDAIAELQAALMLNPGSAAAHFNLGNVLLQMPGRLPDSIAEYQAALRTAPNLLDARINLAYALAQLPGRLPAAIAECQEALRIDPNYEPARRLMAQLLSFRDSR